MGALPHAWFAILCFMLAGYAILDGFDLGIGILHPLVAHDDVERRRVLAAIGPVWDGNEVWLVAFGGLLFLSFPRVYASGFSGFYLALMMVLWLLIGRGIAIEWRDQVEDPMWRGPADVVFWFSSTLLVLLFGVAIGNVVRGVPLQPDGWYQGLFAWILNPYALLVGLLALVLLCSHGARWLALKTDGTVQQRARSIAGRLLPVLVVVMAGATAATLTTVPRMLDTYRASPWLVVIPLLIPAALTAIWVFHRVRRELEAFVASAGLIAALVAATATGLHPLLLPSEPHPERSLTVANSAAAPGSLSVGITWASVGLAIVLVHTAFVYRIFRGPPRSGSPSATPS
ncbi:MAG TPA: cytochrome d ubiquinol oxidase subunit II [Candidatus Dormibacteraeota bacterium]|nr:cytochrome d ubiquinol oxidase subunit II [Candidatus Dormibacteraeota bacterium]